MAQATGRTRETEGSGPLPRGAHWLPPAVSAALAAVVLGPLLMPGYPLRYDLVTVPAPVLGDDALGLGDRLPRAIPLDGAMAALAAVLPDAVITQVMALLALTLAGWGAARLTAAPLPGRLMAVLVTLWNPFVMEQLAIGHVPHLFAYGALPWAGIHAHALARGGDRRSLAGAWAGMTGAVGLGSLTPGGGALCVVAALAGLAAGAAHPGRRGRWPRVVAGAGTSAALQLPWLVAAVSHPGFAGATDQDSGLTLFALRAETGWGRLVDAAGLAGMWNAASLPASRSTVLAQASTVLLILLAASGVPAVHRLWRTGYARELLAASAAAGLGYLVAVLPVLPGGDRLLRALIDLVPGAGLLRDGHRWLGVTAIAMAVLAGHGVTALGAAAHGWTSRHRSAREGREGPRGHVAAAVAVLTACLVVATMPDLAGGLLGRLAARRYPADWSAVRAVMDDAPDRARVLVLPWQPFRRFDWAGRAPVLDPAPRLLPRQAVVSDALTVGGRRLPEEGPGARAVTLHLADGRLTDAELRGLSVGWVLVERGTPGEIPQLPGTWRTSFDGHDLALVRSPDPMPAAPPPGGGRRAAVVGAHLVAAGLLGAAAAAGAWSARAGARGRRPRQARRRLPQAG